jgi:RHS repeat-associated protein
MGNVADSSTHFVAFDGNGNVAALVNAADGKISASYEYGAFGENIRATGPMAKVNPYRFSTKYQDQETGLLYYGRRYLNVSTGRFLSKDPIGERGGLNLYALLRNNAVNFIDVLGLSELSAAQYRTFIEGRLNAGVTGINDLWNDTLNHYLANDPETDLCWDCEDDMEEIFEAFYKIFSDPTGPHNHGAGINAGVHTGDGSAVSHFFGGAAFQASFNAGALAQDTFEQIGGQAGDWQSDTAYGHAGAGFADHFDTWSEAECRRRVREFTTGLRSITGLLGPTPPANTAQGMQNYLNTFQQSLQPLPQQPPQ